MDYVKAASELRQLLVAVETAKHQVIALDLQIATVSRRHLQSTIDGDTNKSLRLALRLSTSEGVRKAYTDFVDRKTHQVQQKARRIASTIQGSEQTDEQSFTTAVVERPSMDRTVSSWSSSFCELYRYS